jgi:hypothetical protein
MASALGQEYRSPALGPVWMAIPADVLPDSSLHCCLVAHISSNHQHIDTRRLLLRSSSMQLLALHMDTAAEQHVLKSHCPLQYLVNLHMQWNNGCARLPADLVEHQRSTACSCGDRAAPARLGGMQADLTHSHYATVASLLTLRLHVCIVCVLAGAAAI